MVLKKLNKKRKNIFFKLDNYRKIIRCIKLIDFYKNDIILVCHLVFLGGYSLKLIKDYFSSKSFELYNYKDNFDIVILTSQNQNYLYNYKSQNFLNKNIFFFFKNFDEVSLFLYRTNMLTLSPYFFYPLYFSLPKKNVILSFSLFCIYFAKYKYKYTQNSFIYYSYIAIINKAILSIFIFIFCKINTK